MSDEMQNETDTGYGVTDPGATPQDSSEDGAAILAQLRAENGLEPQGDRKATIGRDVGQPLKAQGGNNAEPEASDASDEIPDELIDRALAVGFENDELRQFQSTAELQRAVSLAERIAARGKQAVTTNDATPSPAAVAEPDWDKMLADGHDSELIALQKTMWAQTKAARDEAQQLRASEQSREFTAFCHRFDDALSDMNGFEAVFGKGRRAELSVQDPTQAANRQRVFTQMEVLRRGYEAVGQQVPTELELIRSAAASVFPDQGQKNARQAVLGRMQKAGNQTVARSNSGGRQPASGRDLAAQKEAAFWKQHGDN